MVDEWICVEICGYVNMECQEGVVTVKVEFQVNKFMWSAGNVRGWAMSRMYNRTW